MALELAARTRAAFTENLPLKLLSLAFALVLYSLVHGQEQRANVLVNVAFVNPPDRQARELVTQIPPKIEVELRGSKSIVNDLQEKGIGGIALDLKGGTLSHVVFEPSMLQLPPGVTVERFDPPSLDLSWEDHVALKVPVLVTTNGSPAPGFAVKGAPVVDPAEVRVMGPKSWVMMLQSVRTATFDLTNLDEGKHTTELPIANVRAGVETEPQSVTVTIDVVKEIVEKTFTKAVEVVGAKGKAQPTEVDIQLACPRASLQSVRAELLVPWVQVPAGTEKGTEALPVQLSAPEGCVVSIVPATVIVRWGETQKERGRLDR